MSTRQSVHAPLVTLLALVGCGNPGDDTDEVVSSLECGDGTHEVNGACVADDVPPGVTCGDGTHEVDGACVADPVEDTDVEPLVPGHYERPLVWLQKQLGQGGALGTGGAGQNHMHVSEFIYRESVAGGPAELFYCSYTFGVFNADDPENMQYLAQGFTHFPNGYPTTPLTGTKSPGCVNMALDDDDPDIVYTTHHGTITDGDAFITTWDIHTTTPDASKPKSIKLAPTQGPMTSELNGISYEGLDFENGLLWVALHDDGLGVYRRDPDTNVISRVAVYSDVLENAWEVRVVGDTAFVTDGPGGGLVALDVSDPEDIQLLDRVRFDGVAHDLSLDVANGVAWIAAESGGLVGVDISDPTNLAVLSTTEVPGSVIAVDYDAGQVYLAAWNDARVYDVSDPESPAFIGAARLTVSKAYTGDGGDRPNITDRVLGVAGKGDALFDGTWWTPNTFRIHADRVAPYMYLPENVNFLSFPGDLAEGESSTQEVVIRNDGTAPLTVYDMWADNPDFTVDPPQLLIPAGGQAAVTLSFTAGAGAPEESTLFHFASDDPSQPIRDAWLVGNQAGIGVGDPLPETTATLLGDNSGVEWNSKDEEGHVLLLGYWATF